MDKMIKYHKRIAEELVESLNFYKDMENNKKWILEELLKGYKKKLQKYPNGYQSTIEYVNQNHKNPYICLVGLNLHSARGHYSMADDREGTLKVVALMADESIFIDPDLLEEKISKMEKQSRFGLITELIRIEMGKAWFNVLRFLEKK